MIIKEFRIILPMTVEEYQIAQLYAVAELSKQETGGGDGVEVLVNEPFTAHVNAPDPPLLHGDPKYTTGQYTQKYYHLANKVPGIVRALAPTSALILNEVAWNAYPYCRTILTNNFLSNSFSIKVESLHSSDISLENAHQLPPEQLASREVVLIDIGDIDRTDADYSADEDPSIFRSKKTGRGPLKPRWWLDNYNGPIMCAYKLVHCECSIRLLQSRLESLILRQERRLFSHMHRQVFCLMDRWYGMTMEDIRRLEDETRLELERQRKHGSIRGHKGDD
ncbi:unnamed protein product [Dicrocoelium dendriticum]|nr:unnamed protein product [Dicrocoelium dendriticum]